MDTPWIPLHRWTWTGYANGTVAPSPKRLDVLAFALKLNPKARLSDLADALSEQGFVVDATDLFPRASSSTERES